MFSIFYDLETSDKNPIGQILNYCFILVDEQYQPVAELSGLIRISRLQLPDPGAILANRINVVKHQEEATDSEFEALSKIVAFISAAISQAGSAIPLIGYNSSRFDLTYLRTSFIRNGIPPYFSGKAPSRDLLHAVHHAYLTSAEFSSAVQTARTGEPKLSLSLETVCHSLNLLSGAQAHESRADVLLTIEVAKWLQQKCSVDVRSFEPYQALLLHSTARSGTVYLNTSVQYDLSEESTAEVRPMTLLDGDKRAALWIDLQRYSENPDPRCIVWRTATKHSFFTSGKATNDPYLKGVARAALTQFKGTNLSNYFTQSTADIEQDIFRLDFDAIDSLQEAFAKNSKEPLETLGKSSKDAKILWTRALLARAQFSSPEDFTADQKFCSKLSQYAIHRYGGGLQIVKNTERGEPQEHFHTKLQDYLKTIKQVQDADLCSQNRDDYELMKALETYYRSSDIYSVAAGALLASQIAGTAA